MSDMLHQNKFENGKQNGSFDLLDNQSMILEFALIYKKIGTELSLGNVSFSRALAFCTFNHSKCTTRQLCFVISQKFGKAGAPVLLKNLHGLGFCINRPGTHCVFWYSTANNGNLRKLSITLYGLV